MGVTGDSSSCGKQLTRGLKQLALVMTQSLPLLCQMPSTPLQQNPLFLAPLTEYCAVLASFFLGSVFRLVFRLLFLLVCRYHMMMEAFGGQSYNVNSSGSLAAACRIAFGQRKPTVINVRIDPMAGVESGNVHSFNAPKAKM